VVLLAGLLVVAWMSTGWFPQALALAGFSALIIGGVIQSELLARRRVTISDGVIAVRKPLSQDVCQPISSVVHVSRFSRQPKHRRRAAGNCYALIADDGMSLTVLPERLYRTSDLASFLSLLPSPEPAGDNLSPQDVSRLFHVAESPSMLRLVVAALSVALAYVGVGILIADLAMHA
jgi:hypothetical protein